jgi:glycosyltransferase involved in cell wall biosynthesis
LKIDMVSEHASPLAALGGADGGGQNVHVAALAAALGGHGHEVRVFTRQDDPGLPMAVPLAPGVTVEHVPAGPLRPVPKDGLYVHMPRFAGWLAERWSASPPDVVHAHFWMSGLAAMMAASRPGIPVVQTFHALGSVKRRYQAAADTSPPERLRTESMVGQSAAAIIATCTDEVRELTAYGIAPERMYVVPCGVDCGHFHPAATQPDERQSGPPRILTIGRLVPRKGIDTVITALADVPGAELIVAGGPVAGQLDDDQEVRRLQKAARAAGVSSRVTFTGRVSHQDVPALMRSASVVVSAPWYEPFGIVPLEAMACGTPVVVSAVGGHLDTVADGMTGLLVPPRDPAALAVRLRLLLAEPGLQRSLRRAALRRVRSRHGWDTIAAQTAAVYGGLRDQRCARSAAHAENGARS